MALSRVQVVGKVQSSPVLRRKRRRGANSAKRIAFSRLVALLGFCAFCTAAIGFFLLPSLLSFSTEEGHSPRIEQEPPGWFGTKVVSREKLSSRHVKTTNRTLQRDWKRGPLAIFYNIYIPTSDTPSEVVSAIEIVKEQINQVAQSPISWQPLTIYYSIIDNAAALNSTAMTALCKDASVNITCKLLQKYKTGSETVTLRQLYSFCKDNLDSRVVYLHTKGSYHVSDKNTNWRRLLTAAAVSPECVLPQNPSCNFCGLQFFTQFTFFVPGNMFTTTCEYVQKLLPLEDDVYVEAHERAVEQMLLLKLRNQLKSTLLWDQKDFLGLDRYADEHWIGSHPDLVPCDMDPVGSLADVFHGVLSENEFEWNMGPRNTGVCGGINEEMQSVVRNSPTLRRREILLLPGLLTKWYSMYGYAPNASSWVWSHFPDGKYWLDAVQQYGSSAVEKMTDPYRTSIDGSHLQSAFATNQDSKDPGAARTFNFSANSPDDSSTMNFAVFYHVAIPNVRDNGIDKAGNRGVAEVVQLVREQISIVGDSFLASQPGNPAQLFFTLAGSGAGNLADAVSDICVERKNIVCHPLTHFNQNYEGETLQQLSEFCKVNPSHRVSYMHTMAPVQLRREGLNRNLILHMTHAVTSTLCLRPENESCNVCGLIFYPLWAFFFPGNMFAVSCDYVNKLESPKGFESAMTDVVAKMLMERVRSRVTTQLFSDRADYFGLDRYAIDQWVGSHPSIQPCDVSNSIHGLHFWRDTVFQRNESHFDFAMAPRIIDAPFDMPISKKEKVFQTESLRKREYFLLAGHVIRWHRLYEEAPPPFSWAWWTIPDGLSWFRAYHKYGAEAVKEVTAEYDNDGL